MADRYGALLRRSAPGRTYRTFFCRDPEIRNEPAQAGLVCNFARVYTWVDVALQILGNIGWSPERSVGNCLYLERCAPGVSTRT